MSIEVTRRSFLTAMAGLTGAAALAACAPKEPTAAPAPKEPAAAPTAPPAPAEPAAKDVEVRYMSWWGVFITGDYPDIVKDFQDEFPNVTIKLEEVGYGDAQQKYPTMLSAGTAPDILYHMNFMSQFYDAGSILQLDSYYERDGIDYWNDFYHGLAIDDWAGKIYAFPHLFESCIFLYNKDRIKEEWGKDLWEAFPDGNWDMKDFVEVATACTHDDNGDGKMDRWGAYIGHRDYYYGYETQSWTRGDNIFDLDNVKFNFTSDTVKKISHDLFDWVRKDKILISNEEGSEVAKANAVSWPFLAQLTALRLRMSPDVGTAAKGIGDKFNWDLMYLPNDGANQAVTRAGGHGNNIAASSEVKEEAWQFVKFLGTTPGMSYVAKSKICLPIYRKDPDLRKTFITGLVEHEDVLFGVLENRGGYGDHMRFHNEEEARTIFRNKLDLLYNMPYEEAKPLLDQYMAEAEAEMNAVVEYGDQKPYAGVSFPFQVAK